MKIKLFLKIFVIIIFIGVFFTAQSISDLYHKTRFPLASIVISSYNRTGLLIRAIDSALNQTYENIEIIVVDDGSTQEHINILKRYAKLHPKIKLVRLPKNSGRAAFPRAVGNSVASGKYITILDSDDILMPQMIEKVVDYMEKHENITLLRVKTRHYVSGKDPYKNNWEMVHPLYSILIRSIGQGGFTFRRDFVEEHNIFPDPNMQCGEDWDFVSKMLMNKANFADLPSKYLYIIRFHYENSYADCGDNSYKILHDMSLFFTGKPYASSCEKLKKVIEFNPDVFDENTKKAGLRDYCKEDISNNSAQ